MSSELELSKQRIIELEAKNDKLEAEIAELRKENTEIPSLRIKLSVFDAEIAELKRRNVEFLRANEEYNERRDAENAKLRARIEELRKEYGEIGSGYAHDPITIRFLSEYYLTNQDFPPIVRRSWKTLRNIVREISQSKLC